MKHFIYLLFFMFATMQNIHAASAKYKVLTIVELNKIIEQKNALIDTEYIFEKNATFVTEFKDGSTIMKPPVLGGSEGIFFSSKADMLTMMASGVYPVKGRNSFFDTEKHRVLNFENEIPYYLSVVSKTLNHDVKLKLDKAYLDDLSNYLNVALTKKKKISVEEHWYIAIYITELLRTHVKGEWRFFPEYSFNMSYVPILYLDDKICDPWYDIFYNFRNADISPLNIKELIERLNNFRPIVGRAVLSHNQLR